MAAFYQLHSPINTIDEQSKKGKKEKKKTEEKIDNKQLSPRRIKHHLIWLCRRVQFRSATLTNNF